MYTPQCMHCEKRLRKDHSLESDDERNKLTFCGWRGNPQNLQQKPQPLLRQHLQHQRHKERWL